MTAAPEATALAVEANVTITSHRDPSVRWALCPSSRYPPSCRGVAVVSMA